MKTDGIQLQYRFNSNGQSGADMENPLFDLLTAVQAQGSIDRAAKAMGRSYRHTWGSLRAWEESLGRPLVHWEQGKRAQLTPFAQQLMWSERHARIRMMPHLEALRAELAHALGQASDPSFEVVGMLASHDMALPRLQALAARMHKLHLSLQFAGSQEALRRLRDSQCEVAGFHVPQLPSGSAVFSAALRPLLQPGTHKLIGSHRRRQGLMLRKSVPAPAGMQDLTDGSWRFVNRQAGSGTRLLMDHLLRTEGHAAQRINGYFTRIEQTHVTVAAAIASGAADVGLGIEAAAREFGLDFKPLVEEDYYLVCLKESLDAAPVQRLRDTLASCAWAQTVMSLPGYSTHRPGEVLSLTQALPWWRYPDR